MIPSNPAPVGDEREALSSKQIEAGWHKTFSTSNPFCPCDLKSFTKAVRWAEWALSSSTVQQVGADAMDAARYRWLREQDWFDGPLCVLRDPKRVLTKGIGLGADCPSGDRLDAAIDAAMGKSDGGKES